MTTFHNHLKSNASGSLEVEGIPVTDLAAEYGSPLFILSETAIRENYRRIHRAFADVYPAEVIICAGMKGNWGMPASPVLISWPPPIKQTIVHQSVWRSMTLIKNSGSD
jgi:hypothetical protein